MTQSGCGCNVFGVGRPDVSGTGETVGIVGLQAILRQLYDWGRTPDDETVADELLALVKARNVDALHVRKQDKHNHDT